MPVKVIIKRKWKIEQPEELLPLLTDSNSSPSCRFIYSTSLLWIDARSASTATRMLP